jgi:hypothetical protein
MKGAKKNLEKSLQTFYNPEENLSILEDLKSSDEDIEPQKETKKRGAKRKTTSAAKRLPNTLDLVEKTTTKRNKALSDIVYGTANELENTNVIKMENDSDCDDDDDDDMDIESDNELMEELPPNPPEYEDVPFDSLTEKWPISELQDHELDAKDEQAALFFKKLDQHGRMTDDIIGAIPMHTETLAYVAQFENRGKALWFEASQKDIVNRGKGKWPKVPEVTREYVMKFAREVDPNVQWERPCSHAFCETNRLFGWKGREFILPSEMIKIMTAITNNKPVPLSNIVGWCVLCHYSTTNTLYFKALDRIAEKKQKKGAKDKKTMAQLIRIHHFSFSVDRIGEYKLSQCLVGDTEPMGLYGCFPFYNCNHYNASKAIIHRNNAGTTMPVTLRVWKESDYMVFQQAQTASQTNMSSTTTRGDMGIVA